MERGAEVAVVDARGGREQHRGGGVEGGGGVGDRDDAQLGVGGGGGLTQRGIVGDEDDAGRAGVTDGQDIASQQGHPGDVTQGVTGAGHQEGLHCQLCASASSSRSARRQDRATWTIHRFSAPAMTKARA